MARKKGSAKARQDTRASQVLALDSTQLAEWRAVHAELRAATVEVELAQRDLRDLVNRIPGINDARRSVLMREQVHTQRQREVNAMRERIADKLGVKDDFDVDVETGVVSMRGDNGGS